MFSMTYTLVVPQRQVDDPLVNPVMANRVQLRWVMAMSGSTPTLRLVLWYPLVGKIAYLCRVKSYSNNRAHGTGRVTVWSHNQYFFWEWMGWRELFWERCPAVVPCATADEESGSKFKTWILCGSTLRFTWCEKVALKILFFQMNPYIKISFPQIKLQSYP